MIAEEAIKNTFIAMLSGIAEYKNRQEVYIQLGCIKNGFTIEFTDGSNNAIVRSYWANGKVRLKAPYVNFRRHGLCRTYYASGKLREEINYVDGKRHGPYKLRGRKKNEVLSQGNYYKGSRHGTFTNDGHKHVYSHGRLIKTKWANDSQWELIW